MSKKKRQLSHTQILVGSGETWEMGAPPPQLVRRPPPWERASMATEWVEGVPKIGT